MYRVGGRKTGKRTRKVGILSKMAKPSLYTLIMMAIFWFTHTIAPFLWPMVVNAIIVNPGAAAAIFNAILLLSFIGSIMVSVTTVANSSRMEYLLMTPIRARDIFLEKTILIIIFNSTLWLVIGSPVILAFSLESLAPMALLSLPAFIIMTLLIITIGVALGGLIGLVFARLIAGRRTLKQIGYFLLTAIAIGISALWYYSFYFSDNRFLTFNIFFEVADMIGLSSHTTPGFTASVISLGLMAGVTFAISDVMATVLLFTMGILLIYVNSYVSEIAHYSGWLARVSKRSPRKKDRVFERKSWNPRILPLIRLNETTNVSLWYNITTIRREERVFAQYLLGPLRQTIFLIMIAFYSFGGTPIPFLTPIFLIAASIPFAIGYGLYFAGYELAFEGKNLMNLQMASINLHEYVQGKIYSALPFTLAATASIGALLLVLSPTYWTIFPIMIICGFFITLSSGAIAAYSAATGGDFKAERFVQRGRRSTLRSPIRGLSAIRTILMPAVLSYIGVFAIVFAFWAYGPLIGLAGILLFSLICWQLFKSYSKSASKVLLRIESSEYL